MRAAVGQTWASTRPSDVQRGYLQRRVVTALKDKKKWDTRLGKYIMVPAAVLTSDANNGRMRTRIALRPDGSIPGYRLVAEPDPMIEVLAQQFRGIQTHEPWPAFKVSDLAEEVHALLLWPREADGSQNPKHQLVLHQDAVVAIAERIKTLADVVEQSAQAATVGLLDIPSAEE